MKLHITKLAKFTTKQDGTPLVTKDGRPYTSLRIQTEEHPGKWISGFDGPGTKDWVEGSEVEADVEQKGEYLNFRVPKPIDKIDDKLEQILNGQVGLKMEILKIQAMLSQKKTDYPTEDINPEDVPF